MVQGYVPDLGDYNLGRIPAWVEGAPKQGWFGGLKGPDRERLLPLGAMRCAGCGFVEFYARSEFHPS
jgi:hypothetical protein